MSEKPISPLRQRMLEDKSMLPAGGNEDRYLMSETATFPNHQGLSSLVND